MQTCPDSELVRGITKQRAELADEMERGHGSRSGHLLNRPRAVFYLAQQVARAAEACE
jgi:hypothetical protein